MAYPSDLNFLIASFAISSCSFVEVSVGSSVAYASFSSFSFPCFVSFSFIKSESEIPNGTYDLRFFRDFYKEIVRSTIEMNYCNDRHERLYKITYRPAQIMAYSRMEVCDWCFQKKAYSNLEEVKTITKIIC